MDRTQRERVERERGLAARPVHREQSSRPPPQAIPKAKDPMKLIGLKSNIKLSLVSKVISVIHPHTHTMVSVCAHSVVVVIDGLQPPISPSYALLRASPHPSSSLTFSWELPKLLSVVRHVSR